jgi:hypothetical protein
MHIKALALQRQALNGLSLQDREKSIYNFSPGVETPGCKWTVLPGQGIWN